MKFIDLFAGLGGFHLALSRLGHRCVFASEIAPDLQALYAKNFGLVSHGDIRNVRIDEIPDHDILCAGLSLPALLQGRSSGRLELPSERDLFDNVVDILGGSRSPNTSSLKTFPICSA